MPPRAPGAGGNEAMDLRALSQSPSSRAMPQGGARQVAHGVCGSSENFLPRRAEQARIARLWWEEWRRGAARDPELFR